MICPYCLQFTMKVIRNKLDEDGPGILWNEIVLECSECKEKMYYQRHININEFTKI